MVCGDYIEGGPDWDFATDSDQLDESIPARKEECEAADEQIAAHSLLDQVGLGNGRSVRWNLHKLIGEYAPHTGHADILRERIDGGTDE